MRLKSLTCEVLARQAYYVAALSPHVVDIELIAKGLHNEPDKLRAYLQARLDTLEPGQYDAVILGYGLCGNSTTGLVLSHTQMVMPRAHDCITLYLGSKERYAQESRETPGTYWYTADYMERSAGSGDQVALGSDLNEQNMSAVYEEYVQKYGRDNADYLMQVMGAWREHYTRAAYIDTAGMQLPDYTAEVEDVAGRRGWEFVRLAGELLIIRDLLEGRWDDDDRFLVIPPGHSVYPTYDGRIIAHQLAEQV